MKKLSIFYLILVFFVSSCISGDEKNNVKNKNEHLVDIQLFDDHGNEYIFPVLNTIEALLIAPVKKNIVKINNLNQLTILKDFSIELSPVSTDFSFLEDVKQIKYFYYKGRIENSTFFNQFSNLEILTISGSYIATTEIDLAGLSKLKYFSISNSSWLNKFNEKYRLSITNIPKSLKYIGFWYMDKLIQDKVFFNQIKDVEYVFFNTDKPALVDPNYFKDKPNFIFGVSFIDGSISKYIDSDILEQLEYKEDRYKYEFF